jgi:DNA polymerase-3 subunit alpha
LERLTKYGNQASAAKSMTANSLFGDSASMDVKTPTIPTCDKWTLADLLEREKDVVGIYLSAHPLDGYKFEMENYGFAKIADMEALKGRTIRIAGFVTGAEHRTTQKGAKFGKMTLNDYSGHTEIMFWQNNYVKYGPYLDNGQKLMIIGTYGEHRFRPGVMEFDIQDVMLLDEVKKKFTKKVHLQMPLDKVDNDFIYFMGTNMQANPGNTEIRIQIIDPTDNMTTTLKTGGQKVAINDQLVQYLEERDYIRYHVEKQ